MPPAALNPEQEKRTARAIQGLAQGTLTIGLSGPGLWQVHNGSGSYQVAQESSGWTCTCPDWTGRGQRIGLRCKHIEAVRLSPTSAPPPPHKETSLMDTPQNTCGWTKLYHPGGAQVTVPLPLGQALGLDDAQMLLASVNNLLAAGWLVNLPGLEDGERQEEIRHIVRRVKVNDDTTETPVIDVYPDRAAFRILGIYLNTEQHIEAFETVCGVRLTNLPLYEGDNAIERGKAPKTDKYVATLPRPVRVVFKNNPRWEGEEDKKHPKRLFVRWASTSAPEAPAAPPASRAGNVQPLANGAPAGAAEEAAARAMVMTLGSDAVKGRPLGELGRDVWNYLATTSFKTPDALALQQAARLLLSTAH